MTGDAVELPRPFGRYTLHERLNVGGMAEVYVGSTKGIGGFEKQVAVKVIHPRYSQDRHFVQMLIQEAKLTVLLNHVNIVQTFDLGREGDNYFIVMEYINGVDAFRLAKRAKSSAEQLPIDVCAHIMAEVCAGLDYAHRRRDEQGRALNIVHRDVSPQNVLLSFDGEVKVTDFGIAKAAMSDEETEVGVIKGKYHYMSPEQAWGDPVDPRGDVFSAGLVLYELLTGVLVYRSKNIVRLLDEVRRAEIKPPHHRRSDLSWGLVDIVMRACAKRPGDRYQSAGEMSQALRDFLFSEFPQFRASQLTDLTTRLFEEDLDAGETKTITSQSMPAMASGEFRPDPDQSVLFGLEALADDGGANALTDRPSSHSGRPTEGGHRPTVDLRAMRREPDVVDLADFEDEKTVFDAAPFGEQAASSEFDPRGESQETASEEAVSPMKEPSLLARAASSMGSFPSAPRVPSPSHVSGAPQVPNQQLPASGFAPPPSVSPDPGFAAPAGSQAVGASPPFPAATPDLARSGDTERPRRVDSRRLTFVGLGVLGFALVAILLFLLLRAIAGPSSIMMHVVSIPHGAEVWVNGTRVRGETPLRSLQPIPDSGSVEMEVRLDGYETWKKRVVISNETSSVVAALQPSPATLQVVTDPPGAKVLINNRPVGKSPIPIEGLEVGQSVLVRVEKRGYIAQSEAIEIKAEQDELSLRLKEQTP